MTTVRLISVGYEKRSVQELIGILGEHSVARLIDVREVPISRRPGFSKRALASALESSGIQYSHMRSAGNPYHKMKKNIGSCLSMYDSYLQQNPSVLSELAQALTDEPTALLCYERDHANCHRTRLIDALAASGVKIDLQEID